MIYNRYISGLLPPKTHGISGAESCEVVFCYVSKVTFGKHRRVGLVANGTSPVIRGLELSVPPRSFHPQLRGKKRGWELSFLALLSKSSPTASGWPGFIAPARMVTPSSPNCESQPVNLKRQRAARGLMRLAGNPTGSILLQGMLLNAQSSELQGQETHIPQVDHWDSTHMPFSQTFCSPNFYLSPS